MIKGNIHKPFPPYGRQLYQAKMSGYYLRNDIFLFLGSYAWEKAKSFSHTQDVLVLPMNKNPDDFQWPVCRNSILSFDTGGVHYHVVRKLAHNLLQAGAHVVRVVLANYELVVFRRRANK